MKRNGEDSQLQSTAEDGGRKMCRGAGKRVATRLRQVTLKWRGSSDAKKNLGLDECQKMRNTKKRKEKKVKFLNIHRSGIEPEPLAKSCLRNLGRQA